MLNRHIKARHPPSSTPNEQQTTLNEEWNMIEEQSIVNLIKRLPRKMKGKQC